MCENRFAIEFAKGWMTSRVSSKTETASITKVTPNSPDERSLTDEILSGSAKRAYVPCAQSHQPHTNLLNDMISTLREGEGWWVSGRSVASGIAARDASVPPSPRPCRIPSPTRDVKSARSHAEHGGHLDLQEERGGTYAVSVDALLKVIHQSAIVLRLRPVGSVVHRGHIVLPRAGGGNNTEPARVRGREETTQGVQ